MTKTELKKYIEIYGDTFYENTCYKLQYEIIKKIINCKNISELNKVIILKQYHNNLICNSSICEIINNYNK